MKQQLGKLAGATLTYGIGSILSRLISFLLLPLFTAYLSPADYGIISILGIMALIVTPVFSLGLGAGMGPCYFAGNNRERKEATIWTAAGLLVTSVAVLWVGSWMFAEQLSSLALQTSSYSIPVILTLWGIGANVLSTPFTLRLQFEGKARLYVALTIISTAITLGFSVYMVAVRQLGVVGYVGSMFVGQCIYLLLFMIPATIGLRFRMSRSVGIELLRLGLPLIPSFAFLFVLQQGNKLFLQLQVGIDAVGVYTVGFNLGLIMGVAVGALQTAWYPFFTAFVDRQHEAKQPFAGIFTYYVLGFGALTVVFFATARLVVLIMTAPPFHEAYQVVGLSAAAQFFWGVFILFLPGVYFVKKVEDVSIVQGVAAVASIVMDVILIYFWAVFGAAVALMCGYLISAILMQKWNIWKGYFHVAYDRGRLTRIFLVYSILCVTALWHRSWSLSTEVLFTSLLLLILAGSVWGLMEKSERTMAVAYIQSKTHSRVPLEQE